jgi:hypothetical protein
MPIHANAVTIFAVLIAQPQSFVPTFVEVAFGVVAAVALALAVRGEFRRGPETLNKPQEQATSIALDKRVSVDFKTADVGRV